MLSLVGVSAVWFTPVGVCSLVGLSAEFGTLGGMLIGYSC